jgi:hypothetical protein
VFKIRQIILAFTYLRTNIFLLGWFSTHINLRISAGWGWANGWCCVLELLGYIFNHVHALNATEPSSK